MKYVEFFAGIGGFRLAFDGAGHECVGACEIDPFARRVYVHRFGAPAWFPEDLNKVTADEIPEADCWVGGSPCVGFSVAGAREGLGDSRSALIVIWLNLLRARRPRWFVLENVPGLLTSSDRRDFGIILATLDDIGYRIAWRVLDAQFAGVPQRRRRIALVAGLGDGADPEPVLFERTGGFWNLEARGEKKARSAGKTAARVGDDGGVAAALIASYGHHGRRSPRGDGSDNLIVSALQASSVGADDNDAQGNRLVVEEPFNIVGLAQSGKNHAYPTERTGTIQHKGNFPTGNEAGTVILTNAEPLLVEGASAASTPKLPRLRAGCGRAGEAYVMETMPEGAEPLSFYSHSGLDQVIQANRSPKSTSANGSVPSVQQSGQRVRRLVPTECERLQAFPTGHTCLCGVTPYSTAGCTCPDGPRYRVLGNAIAVVVFRKVAERMPL